MLIFDINNYNFYTNNNNRIEFYIYKGILSQDRMLPDKLIKDDDTIASVFKETSGAYNLLISFIEIHWDIYIIIRWYYKYII